MKISLIVAKAKNHCIGIDGRLPWSIPGDMKWFREKTMDKAVIMGRKTWDSLPRKPLLGRSNIVLSRDPKFHADGAVVVGSLDAALDHARSIGSPEAMVIGGAALYGEALLRADRIYLTQILVKYAGDAFFPLFNRARWKVSFEESHLEAHPPHVYYVLDRK